MLSVNNQAEYERQRRARRVPHYSLRKLNVGVASVLLATTFFMGRAHADVINNQATDAGNVSTSVQIDNTGAGGGFTQETPAQTPTQTPVQNTTAVNTTATVTPTVGNNNSAAMQNPVVGYNGAGQPVNNYVAPSYTTPMPQAVGYGNNVNTDVVATSVTPEMVNDTDKTPGVIKAEGPASYDMQTRAANQQIADIMARVQTAGVSPFLNLAAQTSLTRTINFTYPNDTNYYGSKSAMTQTATNSGDSAVFSAVKIDNGEGWLVPMVNGEKASEVPALTVASNASLTSDQQTVNVTFSAVDSRTVTLTTIFDLPDGSQSSTVLSMVQTYDNPNVVFENQDTTIKHLDFYKAQINGKDVDAIPTVTLNLHSKQNTVIEVKYVPVTYKIAYNIIDETIDATKDSAGAKNPTVASGVVDVPAKDLGSWQPPIPTGYKLDNIITNEGGVGGVKYTYNVWVGHNTEQISRSHTVTRTITIIRPDGTSNVSSQSITLTQYGSQDQVLKQPKWGPEPDGTLDAVEVPNIEGYQPSLLEVPAILVNMSTPEHSEVKVTYTKVNNGSEATHNYKVTVVDVDESNKTISTQETNKLFSDLKGYVPANYDEAGYSIDGTNLIVNVRHHQQGVTDTPRTITRTIHMNMPYGQSQTGSQSVTFTRAGMKDMVTGQIKWNPWSPGEFKLPAVPAPVLTGWKSSGDVPELTVTPDSKDSEVTVTYTQTTPSPSETPSDVTSEPSHSVTPSHAMTSADYVNEFNSMAGAVSGSLKLGYTSQHGYGGAGFDVVWYDPATSQVVQTGFLNFTDNPVRVQGATQTPTITKSIERIINLHYANGAVRTITQTATIPLMKKVIFHGNGQATTTADPFIGYKAFDAWQVPGQINQEPLTKEIPAYTIKADTFAPGKDTAQISYDVNYKSTLPASSAGSSATSSASSSVTSSATSSVSSSASSSTSQSQSQSQSNSSHVSQSQSVAQGPLSIFNSLADIQKNGNPAQWLGYTNQSGNIFNAVIYQHDTGQVVMTGTIDTTKPGLDNFIAVPALGVKSFHRQINLKFADGSGRQITQNITLTAGPAQYFKGNGQPLETRDVLIGQTLFDPWSVPSVDGQTPDTINLPAIVVSANDLQPGGRFDHDGATVTYTINYHSNNTSQSSSTSSSTSSSATSSATSSSTSQSSNASSASSSTSQSSNASSAGSTTSNTSSASSSTSRGSMTSSTGSSASSVTSSTSQSSETNSSATSNASSSASQGATTSSTTSNNSSVSSSMSQSSNALSVNSGNGSATSSITSGNSNASNTSSSTSLATTSNNSNAGSMSNSTPTGSNSSANNSISSSTPTTSNSGSMSSSTPSTSNASSTSSSATTGSMTSSMPIIGVSTGSSNNTPDNQQAGTVTNTATNNANSNSYRHIQTASLFGGSSVGANGTGNTTSSPNVGESVGTVTPTAGVVSVGAGNAAGSSIGTSTQSGNALPQTGKANNEALVAMGLSLGGLTLGIASLNKKRHD